MDKNPKVTFKFEDAIISLDDILKEYPFFNRNRLYYLIRIRDKNGLDKIFKKIGIAFFADRTKFEKWAIKNFGERSLEN